MMRPRPSTVRRSSLHSLLFAALALVATGSTAAPPQRGGDLGAATTGDHLYVGQGPTVVTLASNGTGSPQIVDVTAPLAGLVRGLAIHDGFLFASWRTDEPSGQLALFSLADPAHPEWVADIPYSDNSFLGPGGLTVVGTTLFLVDSEIGLLPIDVTDPQDPQIGTPVTTFGLRGVTQLDATHLVAWGRSFLGSLNVSIYDISTPSSPVEVGGYSSGNQFDVALGDGFMVLTGQGFEVVDLSDPTNPTQLASRTDANGFTGAVVDGHLLLGWEGAVHVWDLTDPSAPTELPSVPAPADRTRLIAPGPLAGETFLLTDTARALALDTTIASAPTVEAELDLPVGVDPTGAASAGSTLYLSDFYSGLRIVDTDLESLGRLDPTSPLPAFEDVAVDGSLALLADWSFGVHTVDVSAPESPAVLGSVEFAFASAVDLAGDRGWATSTTNGGFFVSLDLSDPAQPQITSSIPIGQGTDVQAVGDHVYVADSVEGLRIYDVSGATPVEVALYTACGPAGGVDVEGTLAAVACTNGDLHLVDVTDPAIPVQLGVYNDDSLFMQGSAALIDGDVAYFGYSSGLDAVDVTDPASPALIERFALPGGVRALAPAPAGGAWVAAGMGGAALVQAGGGGPELSFDPSSLAFGDVEVGTTSEPQTATLHNGGDADATGVVFSGLPDAGFEADTSACGDTLPAGDSCAVSVTFTPATVGPATASLHAASDEGAAADLGLSGNGVGGGDGPIADITPDAFSFEVPQGGSESGTLNIGNEGDADLTWSLDEAAGLAARDGMPYTYGLAWVPEFHAPVGADRASAARTPDAEAAGLRAGRTEDTRRTYGRHGGRPLQAAASPVVLAAPQPAAVGSLTENFDDITQLPGAGWAMINNSEPVGPTSWFQGNDSIFPSHEGDPDAYIAANYESTTGNGDISNWLLTPEVTIVNGTTACFWTRTSEQFEEFYDRLEVRMSTAGDSTDVGDTAESVGVFTDLLLSVNPDLLPDEYPEEWTELCVTVRERSRRPVTGRFAFRYWVTDSGPNGSNGDYIGIDTVSVTQPDDTPPGGCDSPVDIPWLAADPTSGTTVPGGSDPVTVSVDTTDLDVGDYAAQLCVATNDPNAPVVEIPVSLTVTDGNGVTFVETFDDGGNVGNWTFGIPPIEVLESAGGNPDGWLHSTCEGLDCLDTIAPQPRTTPSGDVNEFTGNYRQRGVTSVGIDLQTLYVDFSAEGRPLTVLLMQDNGTPEDSSDDWAAYSIGDENVPLVGEGWKSFSFDVPSDAQELPAGWQYIQFGGNAPEPDWNVVIEDVSQLRYFYGDPELFYIFQQWEVGLDNARITYTNPGGSGPGVDLETSMEKRDVAGKRPDRSRPFNGSGASFTAPSSRRR